MRIVVEGCGKWAMQYFDALKALARRDVGVFFTYDSTFGLDSYAERLPARLFLEYLQATLRNVETIQKAGFACVDVKDTLFALQGKPYVGRVRLPRNVDAVFIATPDRTHCDVATYWLGRARRIFVEKPFDASAKRIARFCRELRAQTYTQVFAVDHYFVRCNQVVADGKYFLDRLLKEDGEGKAQGDITSFEFRMTEPPNTDDKGNYDPRPMQERALSLQAGMVFDMGAHALPILQPFIDLHKPAEVTEAWAGVCEPLRDVLFSGAESFSIAKVQGHTRQTTGKPSRLVSGTFIIGKDLGDRPEKSLSLEGPGGKMRFDLALFSVHHEDPAGHVEFIAPLQQNWAQFFVNEVLAGRIPKAVEMFQPEGALRVIEFLEKWRTACQPKAASAPRTLASHQPGVAVSALQSEQYRVLGRGESS